MAEIAAISEQADQTELPEVRRSGSMLPDLCAVIPGLGGVCGLARGSETGKRQRQCTLGVRLEPASPRGQPGPALRLVPTNGCVVGSAVMLTSGWLTAATIASIGSAAGLPFVGLGAGCVYGSLGFMYLVYSMIKGATRFPPHAPLEDSAEGSDYPMPTWLDTRVLNWGVAGCVGVGKSSLVNALRGVSAREAGSAPVGIGHTTWRPEPYALTARGSTSKEAADVEPVLLWDLPGAGTVDWPYDSYVRKAGLRYLDGVIFVISDACLEAEVELMKQLREFCVPHLVVRSKIDQDLHNNAQDFGASPEETVAEVRRELIKSGCDAAKTYLVSAKRREQTDTGFDELFSAISTEILRQKAELLGLPSIDGQTMGWAALLAEGSALGSASVTAAASGNVVVQHTAANAATVSTTPEISAPLADPAASSSMSPPPTADGNASAAGDEEGAHVKDCSPAVFAPAADGNAGASPAAAAEAAIAANTSVAAGAAGGDQSAVDANCAASLEPHRTPPNLSPQVSSLDGMAESLMYS